MNLLAAIAPQGATQLLRTLKPLLAINSGEFRTEALKGRLKEGFAWNVSQPGFPSEVLLSLRKRS